MTDPRADLDAEIERITERDEVVKAWVCRHENEVLRAALPSLPEGPLHGVTLGVKDVIDTSDLPTERGSPIYAGRRPRSDAACVALARQAGALVVGKTVTTEFAALTPAVTTNPHNPAHTPGGSSSGSAAAVAAGMVRVAFGTQTVGSVIRPAAFCGTIGFKATHDLVPTAGVSQLAQSLDTVGWFARSVADAGAVLSAMAPFVEAAPADRPLRIGVYPTAEIDQAEPVVAALLDEAAAAARGAGIEVIEVEAYDHLADVGETASTIMSRETAQVFTWERTHHQDLLSDLFKRVLRRGDRIGAHEYIEAQRTVARARVDFDRALVDAGLDALLTPSALGEAPGLEGTGDPLFCRTWTALGVPCLHLPVGPGPNGLPVGAQLVGRRFADADLIGVGRRVEAALN